MEPKMDQLDVKKDHYKSPMNRRITIDEDKMPNVMLVYYTNEITSSDCNTGEEKEIEKIETSKETPAAPSPLRTNPNTPTKGVSTANEIKSEYFPITPTKLLSQTQPSISSVYLSAIGSSQSTPSSASSFNSSIGSSQSTPSSASSFNSSIGSSQSTASSASSSNSATVSSQSTASSAISSNSASGSSQLTPSSASSSNKNQKKKVMTFDEATAYITASTKDDLILYPKCIVDLNHIMQLKNSCPDKHFLVELFAGKEACLTGPLLEVAMKKCLEKEKNTIHFRYNGDFDRDYDFNVGHLLIESERNNFRCQILDEATFLFGKLVKSLQALRNQNQLISIRMEEDFEKLFKDMGWEFTEKIADWTKDKMPNFTLKTSFVYFAGNDFDNNQYMITHSNYNHNDPGSVDDCNSFDENIGLLSSKDEKTESKVESNDELMIIEYPWNESIDVFYKSDFIKKDKETKKLTRDAVLSHIEMSKKEKITLVLPDSLDDLSHITKIMDIWKNKQLSIVSSNCKDGFTKPLLKFALKKCLDKEKNKIVFRYTTGKYIYNEFLPDELNIESRLNKFSCKIDSNRKDLFPSLIKCLKALRNSDMEIDIQMVVDFDKLFKHMKWRYNEKMANFVAKKKDYYAARFNGKGKNQDNNVYCFERCDGRYMEPEEELEDALGTPNASTLVDAGFCGVSENMVEAPKHHK